MNNTPFIYGKLANSLEFTNRTAETQQLLQNFEAGISTILISPRRWGKSSLVQHAAKKLRNNKIKICHLDLFSTRTEEEFYEQLSTAVLSVSGNKLSEITGFVKEMLGKFIPKISINPDPNSEVSISLDWKEVKKDPADILNLAEKIAKKKNIKIVVCIDEFQNIAGFENPLAFQKKIRAIWQKQQHVSYCLYGSKRHMMMDVFTKPSMPFYKFGDIIFLQKIHVEDWQKFIVKRFKETGKKITPEQATTIADLCECHPYYAQQLAQQTWLRTSRVCTKQNIETAHESICNQLGLLFQMMADELPTTQLNYLKAILAGEKKLSSKDVINHYRLGTSANVVRIKQALLEKEILDETGTGPVFLDPYFAYWLKTKFFV
ncbi:MAG: ATPase [Bacteroidia bacterium]|nr:ATPase [Bacteroidia bacterium]